MGKREILVEYLAMETWRILTLKLLENAPGAGLPEGRPLTTKLRHQQVCVLEKSFSAIRIVGE